MIKKNISLGVDISENCISYAVVMQEKSAVKMISAGKKNTPDGAIKDGNIVGPAVVAKTIKQLITSKKYRNCKATVSLTANPTLAQIIELPEDVPGNLNHFVHSEIKHSAILAGKEIQQDYCGLGVTTDQLSRVFVTATEKNKMTPLLKTMSLAGIEPEVIELQLAGWTRAIYEKHIKPRFKSNVLLVMIRGNTLDICVFRNTSFDFVRSIDVSALDTESCLKRCQDEIQAVVQYYDIEFGSQEKIAWDCVVGLGGNEEDYQNVQKTFSESLGMSVHVCSNDSILSDTPVTVKGQYQATTLTAVGLALRLQKVSCPNIKTNLIPNEIKESRAAKKELLIFANAVAAILVAIFIFAAFASSQFEKTQEIVRERKKKTPLKLVQTLISREKKSERSLISLTNKKQLLDKVFENSVLIDWPGVLEDIRRNVPAQLYITKVESVEEFNLVIRGKAFTPDSVNQFSRHLGDSELFESVKVKKIHKSKDADEPLLYTIKCEIADRRRLHADAR